MASEWVEAIAVEPVVYSIVVVAAIVAVVAIFELVGYFEEHWRHSNNNRQLKAGQEGVDNHAEPAVLDTGRKQAVEGK